MNLFRTRGIAATASLCVATTAVLSLFGAQPAQALSPTRPTEAALGFNVFALGNAALASNETEGPVALGGNLSIGGDYQVAGASPGTFTVAGDDRPSALVIGGQVDFADSVAARLQVLSEGYAKVGDLTNADVRNTDDNAASVNTRIVADGASYESLPRVELTTQQPVPSVGPTSPIDFAAAFTEFRSDSSTLFGCAANIQLTDAAGDPLPAGFPAGTQAYLTLLDGVTNVLNVSAQDLDNISTLTFRNQPNASRPLVVNVDTSAGMNNFAWSVANQAGIGATEGQYILWNFPTAANILLQQASATLEGTLYAPNANLIDRSASNIEGQVIVNSIQMGTATLNGGEVHYFPFLGVLSCAGLATPGISTDASDDVTLGGSVSDTATLTGGAAPTGTLTFQLFGPDDEQCTGTAVYSNDVAVDGDGDYGSGTFTPTAAGTYRWIVSYGGDTENAPVTSPCNAENESVVVNPLATPTLVTDASDAVPLGGAVTDTATLAGGQNPTGTITFRLYGPNDADCSGTVAFSDDVAVTGNGDYTSEPHRPLRTGVYRWTAAYSGDANNAAVTSPCNAPNESVEIGPVSGLTLVTDASDDITLGGAVTDTATLSGGQDPAGVITFRLYGPDDALCAGTPVFTDEVVVDGNGSYTTDPFRPTAPGTYRWTARYGGDRNNDPAASLCNAVNESVVVSPAEGPRLVTRASDDVKLGGRVHDNAGLTGAQSETGTITFQLYGPDDRRCERRPVFTSTVDVTGDGRYRSEAFRPERPGTYQWVATYTGANETASTACGDPDEQVEVKKKYYGGRPRP